MIVTDATLLLSLKTNCLSTFNYRKMRMICALLLTALVIYTIIIEDSELIVSKLSLRCMLFVFGIFSIDLWLRGMGLMGSVAYLAAMVIIICTNDNEPNNAAYILLFYDTFAIFAFFRCYNPAKHTRRIIPFNIMDQLPEDGQQAPNILQDVIDFDSDSEDDEVIVHWPPGLQFLDDEDFILGNFHNNAAPAA